MKITIKPGIKGENDKLYFVTMDDEAFSITKLAVLINNLALNELEIHKDTIERTRQFFFLQSVKEAIDLAIKNIELRDWLNETKNLNYWCGKYFLPQNRVKKEIDNDIQITLEGFSNGTN